MISSSSLINSPQVSQPAIGGSNNLYLISKKLFWKLFRKYNPDYQIKQENEQIFYTVFRYFLQLPNFNELNIIKYKADLSKGLLIYGNYGVGKTRLINAIHIMGKEIVTRTRNTQLWFPKISTINMLTRYYESQKNPGNNLKLEGYYRSKLFLDDPGKEDKAFNWEEIMGKLLFERHRLDLKTFVTTNENPSAIAARYGKHIGDRLPEMFNIIKWEGRSWRE